MDASNLLLDVPCIYLLEASVCLHFFFPMETQTLSLRHSSVGLLKNFVSRDALLSLELDDRWPEGEKKSFQAPLKMEGVKGSR